MEPPRMTPLTLAVIFATPALFPDLHPLAVWIGMTCCGLPVWVALRADRGLSDCEGWIRREERADEAKAILAQMSNVRCG
jgi:hypothetical protein